MTFSTKVIAECIEIHKISGQLGFSIWGGIDIDAQQNPIQPGKKGIFVADIHKLGPAANTGLQIGDQILQIDGYDMTLAQGRQI